MPIHMKTPKEISINDEIWKSGHDDSQTYFQERHIISPFILLMTIAYYKFPPSFMLQQG